MSTRNLQRRILFFFVLTVAWALSASAQDFGKRYTLNEQLIPFEEVKLYCLEYCMELIVERTSFECGPVVAPPPGSGCDLPWIDPQRPTPFPFGGPMDLCIPEEPELVGYKLHEHNDRIRRVVRNTKDCTSVSEDTVIEILPDTGFSPRPCPDPGPWARDDEQILSMRRVSCPS